MDATTPAKKPTAKKPAAKNVKKMKKPAIKKETHLLQSGQQLRNQKRWPPNIQQLRKPPYHHSHHCPDGAHRRHHHRKQSPVTPWPAAMKAKKQTANHTDNHTAKKLAAKKPAAQKTKKPASKKEKDPLQRSQQPRNQKRRPPKNRSYQSHQTPRGRGRCSNISNISSIFSKPQQRHNSSIMI